MMIQFTFITIFILIKNLYSWYMYSLWSETEVLAFEIAFKSFQNDMYIAFFIFIVCLMFSKVSSKILSLFVWLISLLLALYIYIDIQTLFTFNRKLIITDTLKFSNHGMESYFVIKYFIAGFALFLISGSMTYIYIQLKTKLVNRLLFVLLVVLLFIPIHVEYFKSEYLTKNFIQNNMNLTYSAQYSKAKELNQNFLDTLETKKGKNIKPNIIIIFAESWSAVDSNRTSGINLNHLQTFDELSYEGKFYKNFFSEASTTAQACVSIFTGLPSILYSTNTDAYKPFYTKDNLLNTLNENNYYTSFIRAHDLDFLGLKPFLEYLEFDEMIGKEEAFLEGKKYSMGGVSDDVLYDYIFNHIDTLKEPYFINITTLSTHIPYSSPKGRGEKNAYTYSAEAFERFYIKLKESGYLENNYLLLFGDHRKMTPLNKGEFNKYKEESYARVVCTLWGGDTKPNSVDANYYNLTDISNSIKWLVSETITLPQKYNNIFTHEIGRDFVIHDNFENRSEVGVFTSEINGSSVIKLDGDSTAIIKGKSNIDALEYINNIRGHYQYLSTESK